MSIAIAGRWFDITRIGDDITLISEPHVVSFMRCNIWHVRGRERDLVIDTGTGVTSLKEAMRALIDKPVIAVATHVHADHIGSHHEFEECACHRLEARGLAEADGDFTLAGPEFDMRDLASLRVGNYDVSGPLITALPHADYDMGSYRIRPARVTRLLEEGDVIDTGDRRFEVLHLPGHSPGSIGLWEASTGTLFSGDAVYDSELIDELAHSSIRDYLTTMHRLAGLPARIVHAGHCPSFDGARLRELAMGYVRWREQRE
jgi:glyoxylase-like metal-dependent hydrolase (beta-lactamase superfamily II)